MDDGSRRHGSGTSKVHPKKQKSGVTTASLSSRSLRSPAGSQFVQKRDLSASTATGDQLLTGRDLSISELPLKRSMVTEAESVWHDGGSKLFSVAAQPTEAQLNTHASFLELGTNASINSVQDEKGEGISETLGPLVSREEQDETQIPMIPDLNRQHDAGSPDFAPGEQGQPNDRMSRYTRRWDSAPSPRRGVLDDSALEVDQLQLRTSKSRQEREKRSKNQDLAKLNSRGLHEASTSQQGGLDTTGQHSAWNPKHSRASQDPALKELGANPTDIQIAAKQTGFLQRHVSAKAERQHTHSIRLNAENLSSFEPRKEQRIDPKERILAWIEQGEAHLQSAITPRSSTQDSSTAAAFQPATQNPAGQASVSTKREARSKTSKGSQQKRGPSNGGFFGCFAGCLSNS